MSIPALDFTARHAPEWARIINVDTPRIIRTRELPAATRRRVTPIRRNVEYPAVCVNERCRGDHEPRPTDGRANLCPTCEDRARDNLTVIARYWPALEAALHERPALTGTKVKQSPSLGISLDVTVHEAILAIESQLTFLAVLVRDERGIGWPYERITVPALATWLGRSHVPWLASHPDRGVSEALAVETTAAKVVIEHAVNPRELKRIRLPLRCQHDIPIDPDDDGNRETRKCLELLHTVCIVGVDTVPDFHCPAGHVTEPSTWATPGWRKRARIPAVAAREGDLNMAAVQALMRTIHAPAYTTSTGDRA